MDTLRELINMWREQAYRCERDAAATDRARTELNAQMSDAPDVEALRELGDEAMAKLTDAGLDRAMGRVLAICADQLESHLVAIEGAR